MKKLLYTLLFGLVVVSCDKNDDVLDVQSITPQEVSIVAKTKINAEDRWNSFISSFLPNAVTSKEGKVSSAKGGDNGSNWLEVAWFMDSTNTGYVYVRPDDLGNGCYDNIQEGVSAALIETYSLVTIDGVVNLDVQTGDSDDSFTAPVPANVVFGITLAFNNTSSYALFAEESNFLGWTVLAGNTPSPSITD